MAPLAASPGSSPMTHPLFNTPVTIQLSLGYLSTPSGLSSLCFTLFPLPGILLSFFIFIAQDIIQVLPLPKYALLSTYPQAPELIHTHTLIHIPLEIHLNTLFIAHWLLLERRLHVSVAHQIESLCRIKPCLTDFHLDYKQYSKLNCEYNSYLNFYLSKMTNTTREFFIAILF